jgi:hypothetical protein
LRNLERDEPSDDFAAEHQRPRALFTADPWKSAMTNWTTEGAQVVDAIGIEVEAPFQGFDRLSFIVVAPFRPS